MKVSDAIAAWNKDTMRAVTAGNLSAQTASNYARDLADFSVLLFDQRGDVHVADVDADLLNDIFDAYAATPDGRLKNPTGAKSRRTVQRFYYTLSRFFNDAVRRNWAQVSPVPDTYLARGKSRVTEDPKRKSIGLQGAGKFLQADLPARDMFILRVLVESGPRIGELCATDRNDLTFDEVSNVYWLRLLHTKNKTPRRIPLSIATVSYYEHYRQHDIIPAQARPNAPHTLADSEAALLRTSRGRRITPRDVQNILQRTGRKVGVDVTPHGLRHTAATVLLEAGTDIHVVRDLLGHSSTTVTSAYLDANSMDVAAAVNLSPIQQL